MDSFNQSPGSSVVEHQARNLKVVGSSPTVRKNVSFYILVGSSVGRASD